MSDKLFTIIPHTDQASYQSDIEPAVKHFPDWYKESPTTLPGTRSNLVLDNPSATTGTYKKCSPLQDALSSGYLILLNVDLEVTDSADGNKFLRWRTGQGLVSGHTPEQWQGLVPPRGYVPMLFKWGQDFGIKTPDGYSSLFTHPFNRFDLPFLTLNAVVDTDKFNMPVHFPFFIHEDFTGIIEKGTPICQVLPFKRETWTRQEDEYKKERSDRMWHHFFSKINRSYKSQYWTRKEYK